MLFQESLKIYSLSLVISFLLCIGLLLIIISGIIHHKDKDRIKFSLLLTLLGSINILWSFIAPSILNIALDLMGYASKNLHLLSWTFMIVQGFINLITFGTFSLILGIKNSKSYGKYLELSGISWIISLLISTFSIAYIYAPTLLGITPFDEFFEDFLKITYFLGLLLYIAAVSFLLTYALKLDEKYIGFAALFFIFETLIGFILEFYLISYL